MSDFHFGKNEKKIDFKFMFLKLLLAIISFM